MTTDNTPPAVTPETSGSSVARQRVPRRWLHSITLMLLLVASLGALVYVIMQKHPARERASADHLHNNSKEAYYCPMHPGYRSDKPGSCPICGMKFVKMEQPAQAPASQSASQAVGGMPMGENASAAPASSARAGNSIYIAPQKQQLIGMRSVEAAIEPLVKDIRTVGKVAFDETKVTHIHTKVSGYIEEVYADYVGKSVRRGQPLFTIYSPDLVSTQQEYLLALKSRRTLQNSAFPDISHGAENLLSATRERLLLWDVTAQDI